MSDRSVRDQFRDGREEYWKRNKIFKNISRSLPSAHVNPLSTRAVTVSPKF